jgi:hypothetical protein
MGSETRVVFFAECIKEHFLATERPAWSRDRVIKYPQFREEIEARLDDNMLTEDEFVDAVKKAYLGQDPKQNYDKARYERLTGIDLHCVFSLLVKAPVAQGLRRTVDTEKESAKVLEELHRLDEQIRLEPTEYECLVAKKKS